MKRLDKKDVLNIYQKLISVSKNCYLNRQYTRALKYIHASAKWAYSFNLFYSDMEAESLVKKIADKTLPPKTIRDAKAERYVFIDSFALDNRGLTQQYLRGLMSMKSSILYILTNSDASRGKDIFRELEEYNNAEIYLDAGEEKNAIVKSNLIIDKIVNFAPSKIFLHLTPWDVSALMAVYKIDNAVKYNINLTDHAFWLGASFFDYNIEFRSYGKTVSIQKRGLKPDQILCLPYYPILPKQTEFVGFPQMPEKAVKILTGGAPYKMLGEGDVFFKMMDDILDLSSKTVIMIAGVDCSSKTFCSKVLSMKNAERVFLLGQRHDINEVFARSDIYLGTYPTCGGLMSQFAAMNGKPIVAFMRSDDVSNQIEGIVNHNCDAVKTFLIYDDFLSYAGRLIKEYSYRIEEGNKNAEAIITPDCFCSELKEIIETNRNTRWNFIDVSINYEGLAMRYLRLENELFSAMANLVSLIKIPIFFMFPTVLSATIPISYNLLISKIKNSLK